MISELPHTNTTPHHLPVICYVAEKSGGHLIPCATHALHEHEKCECTTYLFHTNSPLEQKIISQQPHLQGYAPCTLDRIPYSAWWKMPWFAAQSAYYFCNALYFLWTHKPERVISFGGYPSLLVCSAARLLNIPVTLYELNVEPGKSISFLSNWIAADIHVCFKETCQYFNTKNCTLSHYPVRFGEQEKKYNQQEIIQSLGLDPEKYTIVILGGSQGSQSLNDGIIAMLDFLDTKTKNNIQIIHQAGAHSEYLNEKYKEKNVQALVVDFYKEIEKFYQAADVIICRSGAGTLFETLFFQKPCITIPLETKETDHQLHNAQALHEMYPEYVTIIRQQKNWIEDLASSIQKSISKK